MTEYLSRWLLRRRWKKRLAGVSTMFWLIENHPALGRSMMTIRDRLSEAGRAEYLSSRR